MPRKATKAAAKPASKPRRGRPPGAKNKPKPDKPLSAAAQRAKAEIARMEAENLLRPVKPKVTDFDSHSAPSTSARKKRTEVYVSVMQAAIEFSSTYNTIRVRIDKAGLKPDPAAGVENVYRLRDLLRVMYGIGGEGDENGEEIRDPFRRQAVAKSKLMEIQIAEKKGQVVQIAEVENELARVGKIVAQTYDSIPDILERDAGLTGQQLVIVEQALDRSRLALAERIVETPEVDAEETPAAKTAKAADLLLEEAGE